MTVQGELIRIGRHEVRITHPEKLLFPDDGVTKQDLIDYYRSIASWILPHLRGRPLVLERYPDGINEPGFFQKDTPSYYPGWIKMVTVKKVGGSVRHVVCDNAATLVYLANQACVTPHIWLSRTDKLDVPDQTQRGFRYGARLCEGGGKGHRESGAWGANAGATEKHAPRPRVRGHEPERLRANGGSGLRRAGPPWRSRIGPTRLERT